MTVRKSTTAPADEHEVALAELTDVEQAEAEAIAAAAAARARIAEIESRDRIRQLEELAAEITAAAADPGATRDAIEEIGHGVAVLVKAVAEREKRAAGWAQRLQDLGVPQASWRGVRTDADQGLGWQAGQSGLSVFVPRRAHAVRPMPIADLVTGVMISACQQAKAPGARLMLGAASPTSREVAKDPARWLAERW